MQARDILRDPDHPDPMERRGRPGGPDRPLSRGTGNLLQFASAAYGGGCAQGTDLRSIGTALTTVPRA